MQQPVERRQVPAPAVLGVVLIAVGIVAMLLRQSGIDLFQSISARDWPFLVIVPGLVLVALAFVPAPPSGISFAIAGAIVTMVGSILLYQQRTGHWESWAYAWALIPLAAGLALSLYGLLVRQRDMAATGVWLTGIATLLFLAGAWFFGGVFAGDEKVIDAGNWWPVAVIILGAVIALRAVTFRQRREPDADGRGAQPPAGLAPHDPPTRA